MTGAPRLPRLHISRPRLLASLDEGRPLVVVRGPEGSGKTTLRAEWVPTLEQPAVWVSLASDISERGPFWSAITTSMCEAGLISPEQNMKISPMAEPDGLRRRLIHHLAEPSSPCVLVLDNAEVIADPEIDRDLASLLQNSDSLRLVLASLQRTGLEGVQYATRIDHTFIYGPDLRLTGPETSEFLSHPEAPPGEWTGSTTAAAALRDVTDGTPGQLKQALHTARISSLSEINALREVADGVLTTRLANRLADPEYRDLTTFMLRCSIPDRLPAGLPSLLNPDVDVNRFLLFLEERGILSIDAATGTAEFDPVGLRHVRKAAEARIGPELPEVHKLTAQWELEHGESIRALRHAVAARDYGLATKVIKSHWIEFLWGGTILEAQKILEEVPRNHLWEYPLIAGLLGLAANMNPATRSRALGYLQLCSAGARSKRRGAKRTQRLFLEVLESSVLRISGDSNGLLTRARSAAGMLGEWSSELSSRPAEALFRTQLAVSFFRMGQPDESLEVLEDVLAAPPNSPALAMHQATSIKAGVLAHSGHMEASRKLVARANRMEWPRAMRDTYLGVFYHYAVAWDRIEVFDLDGATRHLDQIAPQSVNIEFSPYISMTRAGISALRGEAVAGLARLEEDLERDAVEKRALPAEKVALDLAAAILHLANSQIGAARGLLQRLPETGGTHALGGAVELAAGNIEGVYANVAIGQRVENLAPRVRLLHSLLLAAAHLRQDDPRRALVSAEYMAVQMEHHGVRVHLALVPRGDLLAVRDLLTAERPRLAEVLGDLTDVPDVIGHSADVEPLSYRERLVVSELATGDSQNVIAERLGVSVNTVKSQLRSSYRKLGVSSREDAVSAAIALGLLASS